MYMKNKNMLYRKLLLLTLIILCTAGNIRAETNSQRPPLTKQQTELIQVRETYPPGAIISMTSEHNYEKTIENVRRAISGRNYRLIREQALDFGFKEDLSKSRESIIYFCNFSRVYKTLQLDDRIGEFLPCRVTIMESNGVVTVSAVNPLMLSTLFKNEKLKPVCSEIYNMYESLISEATF